MAGAGPLEVLSWVDGAADAHGLERRASSVHLPCEGSKPRAVEAVAIT